MDWFSDGIKCFVTFSKATEYAVKLDAGIGCESNKFPSSYLRCFYVGSSILLDLPSGTLYLALALNWFHVHCKAICHAITTSQYFGNSIRAGFIYKVLKMLHQLYRMEIAYYY